jgi:two-component sensor histidine kinase
MFQLIIEDNGIGIPDHINLEKRESLGIEIVEALTGQIEGTIDAISDKGLKYTITFKQ